MAELTADEKRLLSTVLINEVAVTRKVLSIEGNSQAVIDLLTEELGLIESIEDKLDLKIR